MEAQNDTSLFVDWLTVWQVHPEHPPLNSGAQITFDKSGSVLFECLRSASIRGSYSTSVAVKSDGRSVVLSGNAGRFGRQDNLFNLDPRETLQRANFIAESAGLPPFSFDDKRNFRSALRLLGGPQVDFAELEADTQPLHLSRVDLTRNYRTGSINAARALVRDIARRSIARTKRGIGGDESVWYSNSRYMLKFYVKAIEMEAHGDTESEAYRYALENGIVRCELELKRRLLADLELSVFDQFLKAWDMGTIHKLFDEHAKPLLTTQGISSPSVFIDSLPQRLRVVASAFLSGQDVKGMMSRASFYRYRKAIAEYGLDIADDAPAQVTTIIREITIEAVTAPHWYKMRAA